MIELVDTLPDVNVQPAEYKRLLGYPRDGVMTERAHELANAARAWFLKNGRPWIYAREAENLSIVNGSILIDGVAFSSKRLQKTLHEAQAHSVILVAVGAGGQAEEEAQRLWLEEKPDEYFFLEVFASAVVEHLTTMTGARLCGWAESHGMAVLPHYSPGYPEWDISQQQLLLGLLKSTRQPALPYGLEVLESGMLRPKKSLLAAFGLTQHTDRVRRLTDLIPCENCSFTPCQYRRIPYSRTTEYAKIQTAGLPGTAHPEPDQKMAPLVLDAKYVVNAKALKRWADERLTIQELPDGSIDALFCYGGTTCTNTGRPLEFHYRVKLGPRLEGYPIREGRCSPAPGDVGHTYMCRYMSNPEHLMVAIEQEKPLVGKLLNDILTWQRPLTGAGCYCEPNSRKHKWGLVFETIHYALAQREKQTQETIQGVVAT